MAEALGKRNEDGGIRIVCFTSEDDRLFLGSEGSCEQLIDQKSLERR